MTRSTTWTTALLLALCGLISTGCVSQRSHDDLLTINRQLEERRVTLEQQLADRDQTVAELNVAIRAMQDQSGANRALRARLAEEQATSAALRAEIASLTEQLSGLGQGDDPIVILPGLPIEVSNALRDLAAANPDLMTYDEARGMIRLRSDLTFALGSATVNDNAKTALSRLATVLNTTGAGGFDIQVVGHTDAVPVTSARGRQLYVDNRGLSSSRGDAVARVLIANGVSAGRVMSGGRGATHPIAANDAKGRSKANRRVEIFLVKANDVAPVGPAPAQPAARPAIIPAGGGGVVGGEPEAADDSVFK